MNTIELHETLKKALKKEKCYAGTYPKDLIPQIKMKHFGIIINTDSANEKGQHWVALFVKNNKGLYFDSYGIPPLEYEIKQYILKVCKKGFVYNKLRLQSYFSKTCGLYCLFFILWCCKGKTLNKFIKLFTKKPVKNDIIMNLFLKSIKSKSKV